MAITYIKGYAFDYDTVKPVFEEIKNLEIPNFFVPDDVANKIRELFDLDNKKTETELRAVRNAFVDLWSDFSENFTIEEFKKYRNHLSGITTVIDNELWKKGYSV